MKQKLKLPKIKRIGKKKKLPKEQSRENNSEVDIDRVIRKLFENKKR